MPDLSVLTNHHKLNNNKKARRSLKAKNNNSKCNKPKLKQEIWDPVEVYIKECKTKRTETFLTS